MPPSKNNPEGLPGIWRGRGLLARLLFPIGCLFHAVAALRRTLYRKGWLARHAMPVPLIVIGNIIAGGAGKTPLTLWLAQRLVAAGRRPGIISRGYGGNVSGPLEVKIGPDGTAVAEAGDEPLLLARRSGCPVFVGRDRVAAARALLTTYPRCNLILCDDGLQNYRLARTLEIAVIDRRGLMNGWPLPAGPLREPAGRLAKVDAVVLHDNESARVDGLPCFRMRLQGERFYRLDAPDKSAFASELAGLRLHAVAGIGEPQRFFDHLAALGLKCETHGFPDHHSYADADLNFVGDAILTTEKDALKCGGRATLPIWILPVDAVVEPDLAGFVMEKIDGFASA